MLVHTDGRRLSPMEVASEPDADQIYRAIKLEEDRRARLFHGVESTKEWITIWSARVVIGDFINRRVNPGNAEQLFNNEIESLVRKEQRERAAIWDGRN